MFQLIFSTILLAVISFSSLDASANADQNTKIVKRLDDGQPLVE